MTQLNSYELALILSAEGEDEGRNAVLERTKEIITGGGGAIVRVDEWGKRRLAYEIDDELDGVYYFLYFEASPETLDEVVRVLGITDNVLRAMPVRHDKPLDLAQSQAAEATEATGSADEEEA